MCFFYHSALSLSIILPPVLSVPDRTNIQYLQLHLPYFDFFLDVIIYLFVSHLLVFQKLYPLFLSVMLTPDGANILGKKSDESVYYSLSADLNKRGFGNSNICEMERFGLLGWGGLDRLYYLQTNVLSRANVLSPQSEVIDVSLLLLQKMIMFVCYHGFVRLRKNPIFSV